MNYDVFENVEKLVDGRYMDVLQEHIFLELGIFLFAMVSIALFISLAIYSRSFSVPAVVAVFVISAGGVAILPQTVVQIITQGILIVMIALAYYIFKRR